VILSMWKKLKKGGKTFEVNQNIIREPSLINKDPYGEGWFAKIKINNPEEIKELMNASDYSEYRKE